MNNESEQTGNATVEKLAYNKRELCAALGLCDTTLWRLEKLGRLNPVPGIRHKLYSKAEVARFLAGKGCAA